MEEKQTQLKSIWGIWWEPIRKWFYPAWLLYETAVRFYDYALSVHQYFIAQQGNLVTYIGTMGAQFVDIFCSVSTFAVCFAFLTVPSCWILYQLFQTKNLTDTHLEEKMKPYF